MKKRKAKILRITKQLEQRTDLKQKQQIKTLRTR